MRATVAPYSPATLDMNILSGAAVLRMQQVMRIFPVVQHAVVRPDVFFYRGPLDSAISGINQQ